MRSSKVRPRVPVPTAACGEVSLSEAAAASAFSVGGKEAIAAHDVLAQIDSRLLTPLNRSVAAAESRLVCNEEKENPMKPAATNKAQGTVSFRQISRDERDVIEQALRRSADDHARKRLGRGLFSLDSIRGLAMCSVDFQLLEVLGVQPSEVTPVEREALGWLYIEAFAWSQMDSLVDWVA